MLGKISTRCSSSPATHAGLRLDPALTRIVEALADHMVDQDIRRMRAASIERSLVAGSFSVGGTA